MDNDVTGQHLQLFILCTTWWTQINKQLIRALVDAGAEVSIIHGNPGKHNRTLTLVRGLGEQPVTGKLMKCKLQIGNWLPRDYQVMIAEVEEFMTGMDIL